MCTKNVKNLGYPRKECILCQETLTSTNAGNHLTEGRKGGSKGADLRNFGNSRQKEPQATVLQVIRLFPMGVEVNNSDTCVLKLR